jgi:hypothetical protein
MHDIPTPEYFGAQRQLISPGLEKFLLVTAGRLMDELKVKTDESGEKRERDIIPQDAYLRKEFPITVMEKKRLPRNVAPAYALGIQAQLDIDRKKAEQLGIPVPDDNVTAYLQGLTASKNRKRVFMDFLCPTVVEQRVGFLEALEPFNIRNLKTPPNLDPETTIIQVPFIESRDPITQFGLTHVIAGLERALDKRGLLRGVDSRAFHYGPTEFPLEMVDWMQRAPGKLHLGS